MEKPESIFDFLDKARKKGISDEDLYRNIGAYLERKARVSGIPYHGHFELTPLCNFDCKMCFVHLNEVQMSGKELLPAKTWIDLMQQAIDAGMASATLSGGECLTYPQFDDVYIYLKSQGINVNILTNGLLLDRERIEFFKQHRPHIIQVTLYGDSEDTYVRVTGKRIFSPIVKNILAAKEDNLPLILMITPSKYMGGSVKDTIRLAKELDVPFYINSGLHTPRSNTGREKMQHDLEFKDYIGFFKYAGLLDGIEFEPVETLPYNTENNLDLDHETGLKCSAGRSAFCITWDGSLLPCAQMESISANSLSDGFLSAWKIVHERVMAYPRFKKCKGCTYSDVCCYCAAENEKMGSRNELNIIWCERTWEMVRNGLRESTKECEREY